MPLEQLLTEVLMERSAFKSTQELERPRGSPHDAIQALEFEDPSKPAFQRLRGEVGKHLGVLLGHPEQASMLSVGERRGVLRWRGG